MDNIKKLVYQIISKIIDQQSLRKVEIKDNFNLIRDLGFTSLDIAQLVAFLEIELGVDPFSDGVSIMDIQTVREICMVYQKSVLKTETEK